MYTRMRNAKNTCVLSKPKFDASETFASDLSFSYITLDPKGETWMSSSKWRQGVWRGDALSNELPVATFDECLSGHSQIAISVSAKSHQNWSRGAFAIG